MALCSHVSARDNETQHSWWASRRNTWANNPCWGSFETLQLTATQVQMKYCGQNKTVQTLWRKDWSQSIRFKHFWQNALVETLWAKNPWCGRTRNTGISQVQSNYESWSIVEKTLKPKFESKLSKIMLGSKHRDRESPLVWSHRRNTWAYSNTGATSWDEDSAYMKVGLLVGVSRKWRRAPFHFQVTGVSDVIGGRG